MTSEEFFSEIYSAYCKRIYNYIYGRIPNRGKGCRAAGKCEHHAFEKEPEEIKAFLKIAFHYAAISVPRLKRLLFRRWEKSPFGSFQTRSA